MPDSKAGALTVTELQAIWLGAVDSSYGQAFVQAGEGHGFEAHTQSFQQWQRVSQAIDRTMQSLYLMPWSGQTNPPAAGEAKATVQLTFTRTKRPDLPLRIGAGQVFFQEQVKDWGPSGTPNLVITGRRYTLVQDVVIMPGSLGPITAQAIAENVGYGYNNPRPGTISVPSQPGSGFFHDRGTVVITPGVPVANGQPPPNALAQLFTVNEADTFIPDHVGQYVLFTAGANVGKVARIVGVAPPTGTLGSTASLEFMSVLESQSVVGTGFIYGELVKFTTTLNNLQGYGRFVGSFPSSTAGNTWLAFVLLSGTTQVPGKVLGTVSNTTALSLISDLYETTLVAESPPIPAVAGSGAVWQVLDWVNDLGLVISNAAQPAGGSLGMLDAIGEERKIRRGPGEQDPVYRLRLHQVSDVVTPNAIKRTLNRVLGSTPWCFREVGSAQLPGVFYDRTDAGGDFYDTDALVFTGVFFFSGPFSVDGSGFPIDFQEKVVIKDSAGNVKITGRLGRSVNVGGPNFQVTMIRTGGLGTRAQPYTIASGDILVGLSSGIVFVPASVASSVGVRDAQRFHLYFDYTEFRAFFMVGLPRQNTGEFGFAYGDLPAGSPNDPNGFYDGGSQIHNWYDGYPAGFAAQAKTVAQALERVKVGGVGFTLYETNGEPCS